MKVLRFKSFDSNDDASDIYNNFFPNNEKYLQSYLKNIVGRLVKAEFLIGNDLIVEREGILKEVGTDYIILEMVNNNDILICDLYSLKFVTVV